MVKKINLFLYSLSILFTIITVDFSEGMRKNYQNSYTVSQDLKNSRVITVSDNSKKSCIREIHKALTSTMKNIAKVPVVSFKILRGAWRTLGILYVTAGIFSSTRIACSFLKPLMENTRIEPLLNFTLNSMNFLSTNTPEYITKAILWMKKLSKSEATV